MLQQFFTEVRDFIAAMQRAVSGMGAHLFALETNKADKSELDGKADLTVVQALESALETKLSSTDLTAALDEQVPIKVDEALNDSPILAAVQAAVSVLQTQTTALFGSVANTVGATFSWTFLNPSSVDLKGALEMLSNVSGTTLEAGKTYRLDVTNMGTFTHTDPATGTPVSIPVTVGDYVNLKWDGTEVTSYIVHDVALTDDTGLGDLETFNPIDTLRNIWIEAGVEVPEYYNV